MSYKFTLKIGVVFLFLIVTFCELYPLVQPIQASYEASGESSMSEFLYQSMIEEQSKNPEYDSEDIPDKTTALVLMIIGVIFEIGNRVLKKYIWLWIIVLGIYFGLNKYFKTKFNKNDFHRYQGYFREILSEYSVDVLSYIDQFQFRYPSILVAMLLQLKHKNFITIEEDKIIKNDFTTTPNCSEEYLLNHIENGILNVSKSQFESQTLKSAVEEKLLKSDEFSKNTFQRFVLVSFILFIVAFLCLFAFSFILDNNIQLILFLIGFLSFIIVMIYLPIKIISWIVYVVHVSHNPGVRTKKGQEINLRLEGLKNFLKDFSTLDQKTQEQLVLWDEYLIYSVLFEQNEKIVSEYMKYIKIS